MLDIILMLISLPALRLACALWTVGPFVAWATMLVLVLGRMDDPPPLGEPDAVAASGHEGNTLLSESKSARAAGPWN